MGLFKHQLGAIEFAKEFKRVYLHLKVGAGKSRTVIEFAKENSLKCLIITPASIKHNFLNEVIKWDETASTTVSDTKKLNKTSLDSDYTIINYENLNNKEFYERIKEAHFDLVVCDEAHYLANPKTKRSTSVQKLVKSTEYLILMSGTPLSKAIYNWCKPLNILYPESKEFSSFHRFATKYCEQEYNRFSGSMGYSDKVKNLNIFRIVTKDIIYSPSFNLDLPSLNKTETIITLDDKTVSNVKKVMKSNIALDGRILENSTQLFWEVKRMIDTSPAKLEHVTNLVKDTDDKIILVGTHKKLVRELISKLRENKITCVEYTGDLNADSKNLAIEAFRGSAQVLVGTLALGTGLNLQFCSRIIIVDTLHTPVQLEQLIGRVHRTGQKETCTVEQLRTKGTYEMKQFEVLNLRDENISKILQEINL